MDIYKELITGGITGNPPDQICQSPAAANDAVPGEWQFPTFTPSPVPGTVGGDQL